MIKPTIDPNKAFPKAPKGSLMEACGVLPYFFVEAVLESDEPEAKGVYDKMVDLYGFGDMSGTSWGTVSPEGTYQSSYDEDPDMEPLVSIVDEESGVELLVYQYAILAVRDANETIITRMD